MIQHLQNVCIYVVFYTCNKFEKTLTKMNIFESNIAMFSVLLVFIWYTTLNEYFFSVDLFQSWNIPSLLAGREPSTININNLTAFIINALQSSPVIAKYPHSCTCVKIKQKVPSFISTLDLYGDNSNQLLNNIYIFPHS